MTHGPQSWLPSVTMRLAQVPAVVRIVVAQVQGSTPREPGAYMLVDAAGVAGTIGGGRLEWEALEAAREMLQQGVRAAKLMNRVLGIDLGQCCGGVVAVWLECFPQSSLGSLQQLAQELPDGPAVLSTAAGTEGVRQTLFSATDPVGDAGPLLAQTATTLIHLPRHQAAPRVLRVREGEIAFVERLDQDYPAVWLYGAGHVGQALAAMLVQLPVRLRWLDSRTGQIPPDAVDYSWSPPESELVGTVNRAPPGTCFLVMTHDHGLDYDLCRAVLLRGDSAWLGLIGSQSKAARFRSRLRRDGFRTQAIEHLVCPIGVTGITSKWPAAIAVAIAAQLLQNLARNSDAGNGSQVIIGGPPLPASARALAQAGDGCAAGNCDTCGQQGQKRKGAVVTET
jgi:xanthine dehydrogenase accessory factor